MAVLTGTGPNAAPISITNCQITGNSASSGAGIFVSGTGVTVSNCSITGNHAIADGGGIATSFSSSPNYRSAVSVQNCTITGNTAARGGGIAGDIISIQNSTISNNSAVAGDTHYYANRNGNGGGIYANTLTATNCTISCNSASSNGGGVFIATGALTTNNTLLAADNASKLGPDISGYLGTSLDLHYSLVGNASGSGLAEAPLGSPDVNGNFIGGPIHGVIDPKLGPLAYNGGPIFLDGSELLTHALSPGSPAINSGDPAAIAGANGIPQYDERGAPFARVYGGRIDMGAVEHQPNPLPGDYNFDGTVGAADYTVWAETKGSITDLRADGDTNGIVNNDDYTFWKSHFGSILPADGAAAISIIQQATFEKVVASPTRVSSHSVVDSRPISPTRTTTSSNALSRAAATSSSETRLDLLFADWFADARRGLKTYPRFARKAQTANRENEDSRLQSPAIVDLALALLDGKDCYVALPLKQTRPN
jgi:hypothetical protein